MSDVTDVQAATTIDEETTEQKLAAALTKMGQIYSDTLTTEMIPIVEKFSGVSMPKSGRVVATATIENTNIVMNVTLTYDNLYPDPFETVNRMIFSMFFEKVISQMDSYKA